MAIISLMYQTLKLPPYLIDMPNILNVVFVWWIEALCMAYELQRYMVWPQTLDFGPIPFPNPKEPFLIFQTMKGLPYQICRLNIPYLGHLWWHGGAHKAHEARHNSYALLLDTKYFMFLIIVGGTKRLYPIFLLFKSLAREAYPYMCSPQSNSSSKEGKWGNHKAMG